MRHSPNGKPNAAGVVLMSQEFHYVSIRAPFPRTARGNYPLLCYIPQEREMCNECFLVTQLKRNVTSREVIRSLI